VTERFNAAFPGVLHRDDGGFYIPFTPETMPDA